MPLCTGSDGGGSIRIPSSVCGLTGMKPSLGRVPMGGAKPPGWADLSAKGPMARRVRDITLALDAVVGPEPTDLRSLPMPDTSWTRSLACSSCHLDAGQKALALPLTGITTLLDRRELIERIAACNERSLDGEAADQKVEAVAA